MVDEDNSVCLVENEQLSENSRPMRGAVQETHGCLRQERAQKKSRKMSLPISELHESPDLLI